jgi:hypothetical protein
MEGMDEPRIAPGADQAPPAATFDVSAIPEIDHYELDGIPLFHMPMPGSTVMSLSFRVGRADEPVAHGGMTHLAEHLILTAIDDVFDHANGTTEPYRVTFITRGSPSHVSAFLRDVCRSISSPRLTRMHQEAKVLRTESAGKSGMGMSLRMTWMRTGYQGIGTCGLPEFFLDALDEGRLRAWIEQHFVAGNAVIWIAGDLPDDLVVDLPPGPRTPPPTVSFIDGLETPTGVMEEAPGVAASFFVERTAATTSGLAGLQRQLTKRLRLDRGLGYEIGTDYTPASTDRAFASIWATCLPEAASEVQKHLLETIDDVAARGPTPDELSRDYQDFLRELADPRSVPGRLDAHARNVLLGHDATPEPVATMIQERWRLESEHVAAAWKAARDSMILLLPTTGVDPQRALARYPGPPPDPMEAGRTYELLPTTKRRFRRNETGIMLVPGRVGVAIDAKGGRRLSGLRWTDVVGVVRETGVRSLIGRDGSVLQIFQADWHDGQGAIREIDRHSPPGVCIDPQPPRG